MRIIWLKSAQTIPVQFADGSGSRARQALTLVPVSLIRLRLLPEHFGLADTDICPNITKAMLSVRSPGRTSIRSPAARRCFWARDAGASVLYGHEISVLISLKTLLCNVPMATYGSPVSLVSNAASRADMVCAEEEVDVVCVGMEIEAAMRIRPREEKGTEYRTLRDAFEDGGCGRSI
ncbi:hypothetical protein EYF80_050029 [Liparis tanakae]|uniref:Uncharacterized protein n=1 Tax=Liparis tanakae TaxID=230148 RepID=A0A4Z2FF66_9TELE|nr:hypothetical protein EYF80_050029 [Liparis tanakae]